jgi:pimeloyl-ACP methyl ester carboxylesterase
MKGLVLPGYACTSQIWAAIRKQFDALYEVDWIDWPRELTPEFHSVTAFADWLYPSIRKGRYDFVIGHSLGGLVVLELAMREKALIQHGILIESFLLPPGPFFQNLLMQSIPVENAQPILAMLAREKGCYSRQLQESLTKIDFGLKVVDLPAEFHFIYGDRGCGDPGRVVRELAWPEQLQQLGRIVVIQDACHFPMLENPEMTLQMLQNIL